MKLEAPMTEEKFLQLLNERYKAAIELIVDRRCSLAEEKVAELEKRTIAAEDIAKAATSQMTAVLAVLNVLAHLAPPPVKTGTGNS